MMSPMSSSPPSASKAAAFAAPRSAVSQSSDASSAGSPSVGMVDARPATTALMKRLMPSTVKVPMSLAYRPLEGAITKSVGRSASDISKAAGMWSWQVASSQLRRTLGSPRLRRARPPRVVKCPSRAAVASGDRSPSSRAIAQRPPEAEHRSSAVLEVSSCTVVSSAFPPPDRAPPPAPPPAPPEDDGERTRVCHPGPPRCSARPERNMPRVAKLILPCAASSNLAPAISTAPSALGGFCA
mmetsp:Transcript_24945/g.67772  ORF Transcript_24945/g.67772 Transcript_24945/m.67772 type:complete len:241 (-) Transcript_24945:1563-2285(-)